MTQDSVSEELVEIAVQASIWEPTRDNIRDAMRAALTAIAPRLRAEGARMVAERLAVMSCTCSFKAKEIADALDPPVAKATVAVLYKDGTESDPVELTFKEHEDAKLIERLRTMPDVETDPRLMDEAADRLAALSEEVAEYRQSLNVLGERCAKMEMAYAMLLFPANPPVTVLDEPD